MTKLQEHLEKLGACNDARLWAGEQTAQQTWEECTNPSWLLWWAARTDKNNKQSIVRCAAQFARLVLHLVPKGEDRPRLAIEAAEKWAENPAQENAYAAACAARAAAYAAARAADAAYAAACAADAACAARAAACAADAACAARAADAACAAYAADAACAADAAAYAADAAAREKTLIECCNICRKELVQPWSEED